MQVILGTAASKMPLDQFVSEGELCEVEILNEGGATVAYLVPALRPDHRVYGAFERVFQSHADTLRRRAENPNPGITTAELFAKLDALTHDAE